VESSATGSQSLQGSDQIHSANSGGSALSYAFFPPSTKQLCFFGGVQFKSCFQGASCFLFFTFRSGLRLLASPHPIQHESTRILDPAFPPFLTGYHPHCHFSRTLLRCTTLRGGEFTPCIWPPINSLTGLVFLTLPAPLYPNSGFVLGKIPTSNTALSFFRLLPGHLRPERKVHFWRPSSPFQFRLLF